MFTLQPLLERYSRTAQSIPGGSDELEETSLKPVPPTLDKEQFRKDLDALRRTNSIAIATLAVVVLIAFLITLHLIREYSSTGTTVAALFVGFGTLSAGVTTAILGVFRVKAQSDLLLMLSANIHAVSLQTIVDVLAKRT
jgi:predicted neutral ceramidase superfamily lipid hydrolase